MKTGSEAPDMRQLALLYLNMVSSTADVERAFSYMKIIKSSRRSRIGQSLLNALMRLHCNTPEFVKLTTLENYADEWYHLKKRRDVQRIAKGEEEVSEIFNKAESRNEKRKKRVFDDLPSEDESEETDDEISEKYTEEAVREEETESVTSVDDEEETETNSESDNYYKDEKDHLVGRSISTAITLTDDSDIGKGKGAK
jgi:hypothetical protein